MSITDELRKWAKGSTLSSWTAEHLTAIADRIDAEHKKACDDAWDNGYEADYLGIENWLTEHPQVMEHHGWVQLPKDADGEPIHAGDVLDGYGKTIEVVELRHGRSGWVLISRDGNGYADTFAFTRHAPTVEDVLTKFGIDWEYEDNCEDRAALLKEYATKLQLKEDE